MGNGEGAGGVVAIHADETVKVVGGGEDAIGVAVAVRLRLGLFNRFGGLLNRLGFWGRFTFVATILLACFPLGFGFGFGLRNLRFPLGLFGLFFGEKFAQVF